VTKLGALGAVLLLGGCSTAPQQHRTVDSDIARITHEIEDVCIGAPLVKLVGSPRISRSVDVVCENPGLFAGDIVSTELLARALRAR
jgi:hypothetical protein